MRTSKPLTSPRTISFCCGPSEIPAPEITTLRTTTGAEVTV